jgi:hypothetical protein
MTKLKWSPDELWEHLSEQMAWLEASMRSYDAGSEHEAKRLAHSMRTLLHDTNSSHSLLGQLGLKESLLYWSVLPNFGPTPTTFFIGVRLEMAVTNGVSSTRYAANLHGPEQRLSFADWWEGEQIIVEGQQVVTRKRAALALANKDGGTHLDPALSELERRLLRTDLLGWTAVTMVGAQETVLQEDTVGQDGIGPAIRVTQLEGGSLTEEPSGLRSPIRAMVRQTAHELYGTIREHLAA